MKSDTKSAIEYRAGSYEYRAARISNTWHSSAARWRSGGYLLFNASPRHRTLSFIRLARILRTRELPQHVVRTLQELMGITHPRSSIHSLDYLVYRAVEPLNASRCGGA